MSRTRCRSSHARLRALPPKAVLGPPFMPCLCQYHAVIPQTVNGSQEKGTGSVANVAAGPGIPGGPAAVPVPVFLAGHQALAGRNKGTGTAAGRVDSHT